MARSKTVASALDEALAAITNTGNDPRDRPYNYRVESAANAWTGSLINAYGEELGSRSEAIRDLLHRGGLHLAAERAVQA